MSKGKKVGRIISITLAAVNAALWVAAVVFFVWPLFAETEKMTAADWFIDNLFLVFSVIGMINAVALLLSVILYHKGDRARDIKKGALYCSLLLYILAFAMMIILLNMRSSAVWTLVVIFFIAWGLCLNACIALLIIGLIKNRKLPQSAPPTAPSERAPG